MQNNDPTQDLRAWIQESRRATCEMEGGIAENREDIRQVNALLGALAPAWQGAGRGDGMQNFWMDEPSSKVNYKIRAI